MHKVFLIWRQKNRPRLKNLLISNYDTMFAAKFYLSKSVEEEHHEGN